MNNTFFKPCKKCIRDVLIGQANASERSKRLTSIGETVFHGKNTSYSLFQCPQCGSLWDLIEDYDPGGRGHFLSPIWGPAEEFMRAHPHRGEVPCDICNKPAAIVTESDALCRACFDERKERVRALSPLKEDMTRKL